MLLQNWSGPGPKLVLGGVELNEIDEGSYVGSCISSGGPISDEGSLVIP